MFRVPLHFCSHVVRSLVSFSFNVLLYLISPVTAGQVHRTLGHTNEALKYFNIAISLDPKEATALKVLSCTFITSTVLNVHIKYCTYISCTA